MPADPATPAAPGTWRLDRLQLLALAAAAAACLVATPWLIVPFPQQAPWFESAAMFPRAALALVLLGALAELLVRRHGVAAGDSDELDSRAMRLPLALAMLALFVAYAALVPVLGFACSTGLYLLGCGRVLGLPWRQTVLLAAGMALALWLLFVQLLKVAFGHGWLF